MSAKEDALKIYFAALEAVEPECLVNQACRLEGTTLYFQNTAYELSNYCRIFLLGSGKAALPMAKAVESLLGKRIDSGLVVVPDANETLRYVDVVEGSHPIPDEKSLQAASELVEVIKTCEHDDLVIYLLSGGSSALIESPIPPITLEELQATTHLMLKHDLEISHINAVRKHISAIKGGRLGAMCRAECAVLTISDVIGDSLEVIGSAPMYCDESSYRDARKILRDAGIFKALPTSVKKVIDQGCQGTINESPKRVPKRITHYLVGSNMTALSAARNVAQSLGYETVIADLPLCGDANKIGRELVETARRMPEKWCWIFGGETTVALTGEGRGGRNQQLCLSALSLMATDDSFTLLSAGTDGIDGNSDAAGAVVNAQTVTKWMESSLDIADYLQRNDAYEFFRQTDGLIVTGASGTNVMDVTILIS